MGRAEGGKCYPIQYLISPIRHFLTYSLSPHPRTTTMKSLALLVLVATTVCSATEQQQLPQQEQQQQPSTEVPISSTPRAAPSSKKPELVSKRLEQKQPEGRAIGRMEVSDAQLEMALKDKRYLQRQLKCTLGEAPCDPVGRRLRTLAPLVVRGSCPQCTPTEMRQIQKVLLHMQRNFPKEWARIVRTYQ